MAKDIKLHDYAPRTLSLLQEVLDGLGQPVKELPSKLFYDERGSRLFEQITRLDDYYLTRTEASIMREGIAEMAALMGPGTMLIEYGSGSSEKTRFLLDHIPDLSAYVPIDISKEHLLASAARIADSYPGVEVLPVWADYESDFDIPPATQPVAHRVIYYPGSTIGNFHPEGARRFLSRMAGVVGPRGGLLIGVDMHKDRRMIERAYNDARGVTAEFNLNILRRINNELGACFDVSAFRHRAVYNDRLRRVEMHLVSQVKQTVQLGDTDVRFAKGEMIYTESSYKYTLKSFEALANDAGFDVEKVWVDAGDLFSVQYLQVT